MVTTQTDGTQLLQRFMSLGVCPECASNLKSASCCGSALTCAQCGAVIRENSGFLVAMPSSHPVSLARTDPPTKDAGWAVGIAADMDQKSASYGRKYKRYSLDSRGYIVRRALALKLAGPRPGRVLEAGCGPGVVAPLLAQLGADVHGVDLSAEQLRLAAAADSRSLYVQADLEKLPYQDAVFDTVVMLGVFEYLERPQVALNEMVRVTRTGGQLIFTLPNAHSFARVWTERAYIPLVQAYKRARGKPVSTYSRTMYKTGEFVALLGAAGLRVRSIHFFDLILTPPPLDRVVPCGTIKVVDALERRLTRFPRRLMASQFMVNAEAFRE
jgi:ubiquinone/menaquinone biosynthesis C-methylase UbiE